MGSRNTQTAQVSRNQDECAWLCLSAPVDKSELNNKVDTNLLF